MYRITQHGRALLCPVSCAKKTDWTEDVLAVYKVVLLNLGELQRLEVEYLQDVQRFEDIRLTYQVLKEGGRTLKCQAFAFRASMPKRGGCAEQRNAAPSWLFSLTSTSTIA